MAASAFAYPDKALLNFETLAMLGLTSNFKATLHTNAWVPAPVTDELFADVTGELATANGYTNGGIALTGVTIGQVLGVATFTSSPAVWTAAGGDIPVWRRLVIHYHGTLGGKLNPLVAYCLGDGTDIDVPITTSGNTITFTPSGILRFARP